MDAITVHPVNITMWGVMSSCMVTYHEIFISLHAEVKISA